MNPTERHGPENKSSIKKILITVAFVVLAVLALVLVVKKTVVPMTKDNKPTALTESTTEARKMTSEKLENAYTQNKDVVGWLSLPACEIDNRVFQSTDNNYYLRRDENGKSDVWGCYFLDYINEQDGESFSDKVNIIYGHSLDDTVNSERFSKLKRFKKADFCKENPSFEFSLLYKEYTCKIVAVANIPISIDYIDPNPDDKKYNELIKYLKKNTFYDFGVEYTNSDKLMILSTCTSDENVRFIVVSVLQEK